MEIQTNPYLIWQLIPAISNTVLGFYIQSRPRKKRESNAFSTLMFAGAFWSFCAAIQVTSPVIAWQIFWFKAAYIGIIILPTAWLLFSVKFTGYFRAQVEKYQYYFYIIPGLAYFGILTNDFHHQFVNNFEPVVIDGFTTIRIDWGNLFFAHTYYSYILVGLGTLLVVYALIVNNKIYGIQSYGLILGVAAPFIGNVVYLFGSFPLGFPDPTPITFTITGITFSWAIFAGGMLKAVPIAHEAVVNNLSSGIVVLNRGNEILNINPEAIKILGIKTTKILDRPLLEFLDEENRFREMIERILAQPLQINEKLEIPLGQTGNSYQLLITSIHDKSNRVTGRLLQFIDVSGQKLAEENLASAQEIFENVIDTINDSYFEVDRLGRITFVNNAFLLNLGESSKDQVIGKDFRRFTDPKSIVEVIEKFNYLLQTGETIDYSEYYFVRNDGVVRLGEITAAPIVEDGEIVGSRGFIRDITARVEAEREILEQKDFLDGLLQQAPFAIVFNDLGDKITVVNPEFEELFGYSKEEVIGKNIDEILSTPEMFDEMKELSDLGMRERASRVGKRKRKDGSLVDVEMFAEPFFIGGKQYGFLVFYVDITERLKAEADLAQSQSTYYAVLESLQDFYFESNPKGILTYANQALVEAFQYKQKSELIGLNFRNVVSRKSIRDIFHKFRRVYETGEAQPPFEVILPKKGGSEIVTEMSVSPIMENGEVVGTRGIVRDISEHIRAEEILKDAKNAAEFRAGELATINRVAETVSQSLDLNTILQSVCVELTNIFPVRNAGVGLLDDEKAALDIVAFHSVDLKEDSALGMRLPLVGNASSQEVIRYKKTIVVNDAQQDPGTESVHEISRSRGTRAIMIVPLLTRGQAIGTIGMPALDPGHEFSEIEIELAETIASQIAGAVENARLHGKTESALDLVERDLEIGREIQAGFFPEKLPNIPGWEITSYFQAARQVAGDFYDGFSLNDDALIGVVIADVCDKGVGAALFMALFRSLLRAFSIQQFSQKHIGKYDGKKIQSAMIDVVQRTNDYIATIHSQANMFATTFFGVLDADSGTLYYINGGHEPPVVLNLSGEVKARLGTTGPALGLMPDMNFRVAEFDFAPGDILVGFTDGVTDARNQKKEFYSEERLLDQLKIGHPSAFSLLRHIEADVNEHIGEAKQFDDVTLLAVRRKIANEKETHQITRIAILKNLPVLRDFVEEGLNNLGVAEDVIWALKFAIDEACSNVILHSYKGGSPGPITLGFTKEENKIVVDLRDEGIGFDPNTIAPPELDANLDDRELGGMGMFLMKEFVDELEYKNDSKNGNHLIMVKYLTT